jgi:DNA-binding CsgD family transcriptional regulator
MTVRKGISPDWRRILLYGLALAAGTFMLQWLDANYLARAYSGELYITLLALGFLALGVVLGSKLLGGGAPDLPFDGNPAARATLGITEREVEVLQEIADGYSGKEIARRLGLSPNTVKSHTLRLYEKLEASRRTEAVRKARELGLVP